MQLFINARELREIIVKLREREKKARRKDHVECLEMLQNHLY